MGGRRRGERLHPEAERWTEENERMIYKAIILHRIVSLLYWLDLESSNLNLGAANSSSLSVNMQLCELATSHLMSQSPELHHIEFMAAQNTTVLIPTCKNPHDSIRNDIQSVRSTRIGNNNEFFCKVDNASKLQNTFKFKFARDKNAGKYNVVSKTMVAYKHNHR